MAKSSGKGHHVPIINCINVLDPVDLMQDAFPSLAGQALIAMPTIGDPRFERTVIYMCVHDEDGAMGVVVNKPNPKRSVADVLVDLDLRSGDSEALETDDRLRASVLDGGPVDQSRGFVLHSPVSTESDGTVGVTQDIHLTTKIDILKDIANGEGPDDFLLALGFASWEAGQLDEEILQNVWLHGPLDAQALFNTPAQLHYAASLSGLGIDATKLSPVAGRG